MTNQPLEGVFGIPFGANIEFAKFKMAERDGILDESLSKPESLIFNNVVFAGMKTNMVILSFYNNQFTKASIYITPVVESETVALYQKIGGDLNSKYYVTDKDYETYDYPYEANDGHTTTAISAGLASFSRFWNFESRGKEDDYISLSIDLYLDVVLVYENGDLMKLLSERTQQINSEDY